MRLTSGPIALSTDKMCSLTLKLGITTAMCMIQISKVIIRKAETNDSLKMVAKQSVLNKSPAILGTYEQIRVRFLELYKHLR